ncbi:MAG: hypothetical protein U9P71_00955 [Campylobacterota bacterium]|nr:hypothetical protein [Campylobacterota bacterium]
MSSVKRQNHRVHPCTTKQKNELLNFLISNNEELAILVVTANSPENIEITCNNDNVTIMDDTSLAENYEITCNLLISYDLPNTPEDYAARLSRAKDRALILLNGDERQLLYPIERVLGRTLIQEQIDGFEAKFAMEPEPKEKVYRNDYTNKPKPNSKGDRKEFKGERKDFKKDRKPKSTTKESTPKRPARKISGKVFKDAKKGK